MVNLIFVCLIAFSLTREYIRTSDIQNQIETLQKQATDLQAKNLAITELKTSVQTESFIEREARLKLGLKKPGESVVVVKGLGETAKKKYVEAGNDPLGIILAEAGEKPDLANSTKWWYYFFNKQSFREIQSYERT